MNNKNVFIFALSVFCLSEAGFASWDSYFAANVRTREQWGARAAKPDMTLDTQKTVIAVHHTAGPAKSDDATVRDAQNLHMDTRGFADLGYHFLIASDGKTFAGRNLSYAGAHVLGHNTGTIGVNFIGCYDSTECRPPKYANVAEVTNEMVASMARLISALSLRYNIALSRATVKGHKEFSGASTACPGDRIMARLPEIIAIAARLKVHDEL